MDLEKEYFLNGEKVKIKSLFSYGGELYATVTSVELQDLYSVPVSQLRLNQLVSRIVVFEIEVNEKDNKLEFKVAEEGPQPRPNDNFKRIFINFTYNEEVAIDE